MFRRIGLRGMLALPCRMRDALVAESGRQQPLTLEDQLVQFFKDKGLQVYPPDANAFRTRAQKMYLEPDLSKSRPKGLIEKINAL